MGDDGLNQDLVDQGAINQIVGKLSFRKAFNPLRFSKVNCHLELW